MNPYAIETETLCRDFNTVRALVDVSLAVPTGSVFGFLGPNGAGKTTAIRVLLGLLEPTTGNARVLGFDSRTQPDEIRQRCGALLEHHGLYERLSAADNLDYFGRIWNLPKQERQGRIRELLEKMGLWERRGEQVGKWSRGMKQKLAVARALLHRPALVFLDEPTSGLDPVAAAALRSDLARLAASEGVTVFLTTHNLDEAERLCSLVGVIRQGRLLAVNTPEKLRSQRAPHMDVFGSGFTPQVIAMLTARPEVSSAGLENNHLHIELSSATETAPLVSLLVGAGAQVEEVRKGQASLEEAFLDLLEGESDVQ